MTTQTAHTLLDTDGYKFSMAEAGFPLRQETFVYSHRRGGWQILPLDIAQFVRSLLPSPSNADYAYLDSHGYFQGGAFRQAIQQTDAVTVSALPAGSWFCDREPLFTVTGPSAVVSWLEPLVLQLHYRVQAATAAVNGLLPRRMTFTCEAEQAVFFETLEQVQRLGYDVAPPESTAVSPEAYYEAVLERTKSLVSVVGNPDRLFEVGMRAASCIAQHRIAVTAVRDAGVKRTSNVALAKDLDMVPVGTMGHEHVQRHGSDPEAFASMRDKFPGFIFYLPDTFDTLASGIPSALSAMKDTPSRNSGIRFDSEHGIVGHYLYAVSRAREAGLVPLLGLESGWNEVLTRQFEQLRQQVEWPADRQGYGYGGYLVKPPWPSFSRDDVSAVWKISQTGTRATMKFGDEPHGGKSSLPGRPVLFRATSDAGPTGFIAQEGEDFVALSPVVRVTDADRAGPRLSRTPSSVLSPATAALVDGCVAARDRNLATALMSR